MAIFGKQHRYCPNCGAHWYDDRLNVSHIMSMMCDKPCRDEWQSKYTHTVLGKDADPTRPQRPPVRE